MKTTNINRRKFIQYTAAMGGVSILPMLHYPATAKPPLDSLYWYNKPLRILQTVLREPDATNYDASAVVAYMEKSGCNTLVVNGGGILRRKVGAMAIDKMLQ